MRLTFLLALLLTPSAWADGDCSPNATAAQIETAKARTLADPDLKNTITEHDYQKLTIEKPDGSLVLSYFTLPSHPAHSSNVLTAVYEAEGQIWAYSKGFTAGNCRCLKRGSRSSKSNMRRFDKRSGSVAPNKAFQRTLGINEHGRI